MNLAQPLHGHAILFDLDWNPDCCIKECLELCDQLQVPATFFVTHDTPVLDVLRDRKNIELGIHPNFALGSTQGNTPREVIKNLLEIVPEAKSIRTHGLFQWTGLFQLIANEFPELEIDASIVLLGHRNLQLSTLPLTGGKSIFRIPVAFEDDLHALSAEPDWGHAPDLGEGVLCYAFHPTHITLNLSEMGQYEALKDRIAPAPLYYARRSDFDEFENTGEGARSLLKAIVAQAGSSNFHTISDLVQRVRHA